MLYGNAAGALHVQAKPVTIEGIKKLIEGK
jgi:hypothetical protein